MSLVSPTIQRYLSEKYTPEDLKLARLFIFRPKPVYRNRQLEGALKDVADSNSEIARSRRFNSKERS